MPKETIATTTVYNGDDDTHTNILKVAWGAKGDCPEAPEGWVNGGYAHLYIGTKDEPFLGTVELGEDEIDHLINVLKRVRRQAFRAQKPKPDVTLHLTPDEAKRLSPVIQREIDKALRTVARVGIR